MINSKREGEWNNFKSFSNMGRLLFSTLFFDKEWYLSTDYLTIIWDDLSKISTATITTPPCRIL